MKKDGYIFFLSKLHLKVRGEYMRNKAGPVNGNLQFYRRKQEEPDRLFNFFFRNKGEKKMFQKSQKKNQKRKYKDGENNFHFSKPSLRNDFFFLNFILVKCLARKYVNIIYERMVVINFIRREKNQFTELSSFSCLPYHNRVIARAKRCLRKDGCTDCYHWLIHNIHILSLYLCIYVYASMHTYIYECLCVYVLEGGVRLWTAENFLLIRSFKLNLFCWKLTVYFKQNFLNKIIEDASCFLLGMNNTNSNIKTLSSWSICYFPNKKIPVFWLKINILLWPQYRLVGLKK